MGVSQVRGCACSTSSVLYVLLTAAEGDSLTNNSLVMKVYFIKENAVAIKECDYICEFCGETYTDYEAHRMGLCCCYEQLTPDDLYEEEDE